MKRNASALAAALGMALLLAAVLLVSSLLPVVLTLSNR